MNKTIYAVCVGNVGMVLETNQRSAAIRCFQDYVILSDDQFGRASGEDVTLFGDGEILLGHIGALNG